MRPADSPGGTRILNLHGAAAVPQWSRNWGSPVYACFRSGLPVLGRLASHAFRSPALMRVFRLHFTATRSPFLIAAYNVVRRDPRGVARVGNGESELIYFECLSCLAGVRPAAMPMFAIGPPFRAIE